MSTSDQGGHELVIVSPMKTRLDKLLVDRGLAASRERAQALILAGRVLVAEQRVDKPGTPIAQDASLRLLGDDLRYVSRGGLKLERALDHWGLDPAGLACVDVGTSTGGFTDCLLQRDAASVLCIDTGYGQIAEKLRTDSRVSLMERTNARLLKPHSLAGQRISLIVMDVSFISATLVLPSVLNALADAGQPWGGDLILLVKPQFEAGREHVGKGGIVRDPAARRLAIDRLLACVEDQRGSQAEVIDSPIHGMEGNHEYLLHARWTPNAV